MFFTKNGRLVQDGVDNLIPFISSQPVDMVAVDILASVIREKDKASAEELRSSLFAQNIKALPYNLVSTSKWLKETRQIPDEITEFVQKRIRALKEIGCTFRIKTTIPQLYSASRSVFLNYNDVLDGYRGKVSEDYINSFTLGKYFASEVDRYVQRNFVWNRVKDGFLETKYVEPSENKEGEVRPFSDGLKLGRYFAILSPKFNGLRDHNPYNDINRNKSIVVFLDRNNQALDIRLCECSAPVRLPKAYRRKVGVLIHEPVVDGLPSYGEYINIFAVTLDADKDQVSKDKDVLESFFCESIVSRYKKIKGDFAQRLLGEVAHDVGKHIEMRKRVPLSLVKKRKSKINLGTMLKEIGDRYYEDGEKREDLFKRYEE